MNFENFRFMFILLIQTSVQIEFLFLERHKNSIQNIVSIFNQQKANSLPIIFYTHRI